MIGSNAGRVVEPFGAYRTLDTVHEGIRSAQQREDRDKAKEENSAIRAAANRKKFLEQEYPLRYKEELGAKRESLYGDYENLVASGVKDPFTSTDPSSVSFQKKFAEWGNMVNFANQIDGHITEQDKLVSKQQPGYYTDESVAEMYGYTDLSLEEAINTKMPSLKRTSPVTDTFEFVSTIGSRLQGIDPEFGVDMASKWVSETVDSIDPSKRDIIERYQKKFDSLPRTERFAIEQKAARSGFADPLGAGVVKQMLLDDVMGTKEPFDAEKFKDSVVKDIKPVDIEGANEKYSSFSKTDTKKLGEQIGNVLLEKMKNKPASYMYFREFLNMPNATDKEIEDAAVKYAKDAWKDNFDIKNKWNKRVLSESGGKQTEGDKTKAESAASIERWVGDIKSVDPEKRKEAINFISTNPDFKQAVGLSSTSRIKGIVTDTPGLVPIPLNVIRLEVENKDGDIKTIDVMVDDLTGEMGKNAVSTETRLNKRVYGSSELGNSVTGQAPTAVQKGKYD